MLEWTLVGVAVDLMSIHSYAAEKADSIFVIVVPHNCRWSYRLSCDPTRVYLLPQHTGEQLNLVPKSVLRVF